MMSKKYKVLKIIKSAGAGFRAADPILILRETEELAKYDAEFVEVADNDKNEVVKALQNTDVIRLAGVPITRWIVEAAPKCIAIMTPNVGFDDIDVTAATENNIIVVNNPSFEWCVEEVSNHALTLLLASAKKILILNGLVKQGKWAEAKKAQKPMGSIYGQTLGIIGCGAIGRMTARKAHSFGLKVLGYDPYVEKYLAKENGITLVSLSELLKESDYVSAHPDLNKSSHHMMGEKEFNQMKPSAYFINTSRGKVVDEVALVKALSEKWIAGAALDVFEKEPVEKENPLLNMDNVIVMSHSASYSDAAFALAPVNIAKEIGRVLSGKWPNNVVNKSIKPRVELVKEKY
jgi:D-3-phosphoglycerate dehydrogenase